MAKSEKEKRLLEDDIKALLIEHLRQKGDISKDSVIINELTIDDFSGRADLVVADDSGLYAYEIKSEADSLLRLENQIARYAQFFDKVVIVAASKHIPNILEMVSDAVAVWSVSDEGFKIVQRGKTLKKQEIASLLKLMKVRELKKLASKVGRAPEVVRRALLEAVLYDVSRAKVREAAIQALRERYCHSSKHFWRITNRGVKPHHIIELSPYLAEKRRIERLEAEQKMFWERWSEEIKKLPDDPLLFDLFKEEQENLFGEVPASIKNLLAA